MTTELATETEPVAPLKSGPYIWWMGFGVGTSFDEAAAIFERKHGKAPNAIVRDGGCVKAGPIDADPAP
jgi:hypothetical protein